MCVFVLLFSEAPQRRRRRSEDFKIDEKGADTSSGIIICHLLCFDFTYAECASCGLLLFALMRRAGIRLKKKASTPPEARNITTTAVRKRSDVLTPVRGGAEATMIFTQVVAKGGRACVCVYIYGKMSALVCGMLRKKNKSRSEDAGTQDPF